MNGLNVGLELKKANPAQETMRLGLGYPLGNYQSRPPGWELMELRECWL